MSIKPIEMHSSVDNLRPSDLSLITSSSLDEISLFYHFSNVDTE